FLRRWPDRYVRPVRKWRLCRGERTGRRPVRRGSIFSRGSPGAPGALPAAAGALPIGLLLLDLGLGPPPPFVGRLQRLCLLPGPLLGDLAGLGLFALALLRRLALARLLAGEFLSRFARLFLLAGKVLGGAACLGSFPCPVQRLALALLGGLAGLGLLP